ncbi:MAG: hypothetical protein M3R10_06085, partial [Verrucomicrobiota bacterium]|nr:hypothetical protein [Verrucomicrobiota bacterium]
AQVRTRWWLSVCLVLIIPAAAEAKIGESVPELLRRFGSAYTVESAPFGKVYRFRSPYVNVDAVVESNHSICETYFSDHHLSANHEAPNEIVQAILRNNLPGERWVEFPDRPLEADYAMRSSDSQYCVFLAYTGQFPTGVTWTMTVANTVGGNSAESLARDALRFARSGPKGSKDLPAPSSLPNQSPPPMLALPTPTPTPAPTPNWTYSKSQDAMGRGTTRTARVRSDNVINFGFPYEGPQQATLVLRFSPKDGRSVMLRVERGQFTSSYVQNFFTMKFDGGELQKFIIGESAGDDPNIMFLRDESGFIKQLKRAKKLRIETSFYHEGDQILIFDVKGLDMSQLGEE